MPLHYFRFISRPNDWLNEDYANFKNNAKTNKLYNKSVYLTGMNSSIGQICIQVQNMLKKWHVAFYSLKWTCFLIKFFFPNNYSSEQSIKNKI